MINLLLKTLFTSICFKASAEALISMPTSFQQIRIYWPSFLWSYLKKRARVHDRRSIYLPSVCQGCLHPRTQRNRFGNLNDRNQNNLGKMLVSSYLSQWMKSYLTCSARFIVLVISVCLLVFVSVQNAVFKWFNCTQVAQLI